jgi:hypothetical protein
MIYESSEDPEKRPSLQVVDWSPDGRSVYFSYSAPDKYVEAIQSQEIYFALCVITTEPMADLTQSMSARTCIKE